VEALVMSDLQHEVDAPAPSAARPAYGSRSAVTKAQSLVPDEPIDAALHVRRPWTMPIVIGVVLLGVQVEDWVSPGPRRHMLLLVGTIVSIVAVMLGCLWLRDRASGLRLGLGQALVAVTPTRVLVISTSSWPLTGRRIVLELDRAARPVAQVEGAAWLRTLAVRLPSESWVLLRVFQGTRGANRCALPLVAGPPGSCWGQRPDDPAWMARLWTPDGWTATTIPVRDVLFSRVEVDLLPREGLLPGPTTAR
jgi:hypothetical protein